MWVGMWRSKADGMLVWELDAVSTLIGRDADDGGRLLVGVVV